MTVISARWLLDQGALEGCQQYKLYVQTFGEGPVEVTLDNLLRAADAGLSIEWLYLHYPYNKSRRKFNNAINSIWRQHYDNLAQSCPHLNLREKLWRQYNRNLAPILMEFLSDG